MAATFLTSCGLGSHPRYIGDFAGGDGIEGKAVVPGAPRLAPRTCLGDEGIFVLAPSSSSSLSSSSSSGSESK